MPDALALQGPEPKLRERSVVVELESWPNLWPSAEPLMLAHRQELGQMEMPLAPDHDRILALEGVGGLLCFGARSWGQLVGYSIWYLMPSLESRGVLLGQQAPWYVAPDWRETGLGLALWRASKRELARRGASWLLAHRPEQGGGEGLDKFFTREGGKKIEHVWLLPLEGAE